MTRAHSLLIASIVFSLSTGAAGIAAQPIEFSVCSFDVECEDRCLSLFGDLNGDGRVDILIWDGKNLRAFLAGDAGFTPIGGKIRLPRGTRLFDVGDTDGDGKDEIVVLSPDGVRAIEIKPDGSCAPREVIALRCNLPGKSVVPGSLLADVDEDGRDDIWLVKDDNLCVYLQTDPGRFVLRENLPVPPASKKLEPEGAPFQLALLDADGDDEEDLFCMTPDGICLFRRSQGMFSAGASWNLDFAPYLDEDDAREITDEDLADVTLFEDVTADGRNEFFLSSWSRGKIYIFRDEARFFEKDPAQVLDVGATVMRISTFSRKGSDLPELMINRLELPNMAGAMFRVITKRAITLKFWFLLFEPDGTGEVPYHDGPAKIREITVRAKKGDEKSLDPQFLTRNGDFSGDGWNDFVVLGDSATLEFHFAREDDEFGKGRRYPPFFSDDELGPMTMAEFTGWTHGLILEQVKNREPDATVPIPSPKGFAIVREWILDLNGDGLLDLVVPYVAADESGRAKYVILLSNG